MQIDDNSWHDFLTDGLKTEKLLMINTCVPCMTKLCDKVINT